MIWYLGVWKKYAGFAGRARRKEYWMFYLFNLIVSFLLAFVDNMAGLANESGRGPLGAVYSLAVFLPSLAVGIRRMHDTNHSGWWVIAPFINLIFALTAGTEGANKYGPDPKSERQAYGDAMQDSGDPISTRTVRTSEQRALMPAGLVVVALGLTLVIAGLVWGQYVYVAERPIQLMQQQAVESLNGELADGIEISGAIYAPPTYLQTAISQPFTWLGALALATGFCMLIVSVPRPDTPASDAVLPTVQTPSQPDDAVFIVDE